MLVALMGVWAVADSPEPEPTKPAPPKRGQVRIQVLGTNDLHGYLEPKGDYGGAAYLAGHFDKLAATAPGRTIRVHAGDMIGASPLISSYFNHRSTLATVNRMGFDVGTVGNHEFDNGAKRIADLLKSVRFPYVSANVTDLDGHLNLKPYEIVERAGVRIGFIGVTTDSAPVYLLPRFAKRLRFGDQSDAVNRWVPELQRRGVEAIVVLAHEGGYQSGGPGTPAAGKIVDETKQMSDAVDAVVSAHTHSFLNTRVDGKLLVQSYSFGTAIDRVQLTVDRGTGDVVSSSAEIPRTWHSEVRPDREIDRIVKRYAGEVDPVSSRVVANSRRSLSRERGNLGKVVAKAQRAQARADVAFVNPGNMRADLDKGPVTYGALCSIAAYGHPVMRLKLRGSDFPALLEEQWREGGRPTLLYTSGIRYDRDGSKVERVTDSAGRRLDPDRMYTVAANELIATGNRFTVLRDRGRDKTPVGTDTQALVSYLERHPRALR
jgi:5'-nucleotidase